MTGRAVWSWKGVCAGLQSAAAAAVAAAGSAAAAGVGNGFSSLANTLAAGYGNSSLGTIGSPALGSLGSGIMIILWLRTVSCCDQYAYLKALGPNWDQLYIYISEPYAQENSRNVCLWSKRF
jgi:hypothetical protein